MKSGFLQAIYVGALIFAVTLSMPAQNTGAPPDVKAFAAQYVAAFNAKDKARVESLYLPQSRACMTPANHDVYDAMLSMEMRDSVPPNYTLSFTDVNEGNLKALASLATFPVKPERELNINYQYPETNDLGGIVIYLVRQDGRWIADFPCMTAQGIKNYRDNAAARQHYKALAAAIKEPLRSQLLVMLRAHKIGEAETRYQQVAGGDIRTSMLVINALRDQVR